MMQHQPCRKDGFTLVELMSAVAIMTILAAISWQAMQAPLQEQRLRQAAVELADLLNTARTTAAKNSTTCTISQLTVSRVTSNCDPLRPLALNLSLIGPANLRIVAPIPPLTNTFIFTKYGTLEGATSIITVLGVSSGTSWQWCVDVSAPAAIVRVGTRANAASTCNYLRK
jgi:prepilin-type N-terminal cleavage/methylation domain-containing protein